MTQMPQTVGNVAYTYVQDAEPSSPAEGETWYDTGANAAYVWDGAAWIEETVTELTNLSDVSGVTSLTEDTQANRPSAGTEGRIYIESDTGRVLYDDGSSWVGVGESSHSNLDSVSTFQHINGHKNTVSVGANSTTTFNVNYNTGEKRLSADVRSDTDSEFFPGETNLSNLPDYSIGYTYKDWGNYDYVEFEVANSHGFEVNITGVLLME